MSLTLLQPPAAYSPPPSIIASPASKDEIRLQPRQILPPDGFAGSPDRQPAWDILVGSRRVGQVGLDFAASEFDGALSPHCPALRVFISPGYRGCGYGTAAALAFLKTLRDRQFDRPIQACHTENDACGAAMLSACGFLYTGCRSTAADGRVQRHMIALL